MTKLTSTQHKANHKEYIEKHGRSKSSVMNDAFANKATSDRLPWEPWEDDILHDKTITIADRSRKLKRSYKACYTRLRGYNVAKTGIPLTLKKKQPRSVEEIFKDFD